LIIDRPQLRGGEQSLRLQKYSVGKHFLALVNILHGNHLYTGVARLATKNLQRLHGPPRTYLHNRADPSRQFRVQVLFQPYIGAIMRRLFIIGLATALVAGPTLAGTSTEVRVTAEQLQNVEGSYVLSNGRVLRLVTLDNRLYADLKGFRTELFAAAENVFVSKNGAINVTFIPEATQDKVAVSFGSDPSAALARARALPELGSRSLWAMR
jgi:hypothetical protein